MSIRTVGLLSLVGGLLLVPMNAGAQFTQTFGSFKATTSIAYTAPAAGGRSAALAWRCMTDGLNIIYLIGRPVGADTDTTVGVHTRIDGGEADERRWTLLEGHRAAYLPRAVIEQFTVQAIGAKRIELQVVDPQTGETYTDEFGLDGLRGALQHILPCEY